MSGVVPSGAPGADPWAALGRARFVSLATYRRSGARVATPVWAAADGEALVVSTPVGSGKLKRLRNDGRVQLSPCGRFGEVEATAAVSEGRCRILGPDGDHPRETRRLERKYGLEYRLVIGLERRSRRLRGESDQRILLRITPAAASD